MGGTGEVGWRTVGSSAVTCVNGAAVTQDTIGPADALRCQPEMSSVASVRVAATSRHVSGSNPWRASSAYAR